MARKFWEKLSNSHIQFYDDPLDLLSVDVDARIQYLQELLALSSPIKALILRSHPGISDEAGFDKIFEDELAILADQKDYFGNDNVTVQELIDVVEHRWMSPADMTLGAGTIVSVCGEEVASPAIGAIDGVGANSWQHDVDEVHVIVFDLGYKKRIDMLRVKNTAVPGGPLQLSGVDVDVANTVNKLDDPVSRVGVGLDFTGANDQDQPLTKRSGRFVRITVGSTGHASNHITVRDFEIRTVPRTSGL